MKKIVCALVVLILAAPASAATTITAVEDPCDNASAIIGYTGDDVVRCFGLDIQLDNDETIIAVECLSDDYYVNPQKYTYEGGTPDYGDTPCLCNPHPGLLPGIDTNGISIAMCSLYADNDPDHNVPPAAANGLVRITVSGSCCITITENYILPGVLLEDNSPANPTLPNDPCLCLDVGCQCLGDVTDTAMTIPYAPDGKVNIGDLNALLMAMFAVYPAPDPTGLYDIGMPAGMECMDITDTAMSIPYAPDGKINIGDLNALLMAMFGVYPAPDPTGLYEIPCL